MLLLILQVALLVFLGCGVITIVTVFVIRGRRMDYRQEPDPYVGSLGPITAVPPTPLPEWAHWTESEPSNDPDEAPPPPR
jgi:hypothetical protein